MIYLIKPVFDVVSAIISAGHDVSMEPAGGGKDYTEQDVIIAVHHSAERACVQRLRIRIRTSAMSGSLSIRTIAPAVATEALSDLYGSANPYLDYIATHADAWAAVANNADAINAMYTV